MPTYKTTTGLTRAIEDMITRLEGSTIADDREYREASDKVSSLLRQCHALWSSPADVDDFAKLANRLSDAWNKATA